MNAKANNTNEKVRQLQRKLYQAAKLSGKRKFHALFDKIYRMDILEESWKRVKSNKGAGGIDHMTLADVEVYGVVKLLKEISEELISGKYRPRPTERIYIPKDNGKTRPLGLPTVRDKIVQMATKMVIEPIFEADFKDFSYGFRPKRSQHMALEVVKKACNNKGYWVVDTDIKSYFDNINHDKLMLLVEERINDRRILKLIRGWLKAGVMVDGKLEATVKGGVQGGVITPLLSNIYLNYRDRIWEKYGSHLGKLVRFADDSVVICKTKKDANHAMGLIREIMRRLELELNEEKTKLVSLWGGKEGFDFLGMHHRSSKEIHSRGHVYYTTIQFPSKKAMKRMKLAVKELLGNRGRLKMDIKDLIKIMNPKIRGW
ncbi:MAG: group II intron reverse transcriptase/maturase, partial [Clostridiales bacterium]|nr:group II intron reverse transcriptase/maturase [Clostridiales bacterium]